MRIIFTIMQIVCLLLCCAAVAAAESTADREPINWEISMMPKPSAAEQEKARWSIVLENNVGIYAYDMGSMAYVQTDGGDVDTNQISVLVKAVFTSKEVLKKVQEQYKTRLKDKEKVQYCLLAMQFKLQEQLYTVERMEVFTNKDRLIDTKLNDKFVPVPPKTFAEAMYEICAKEAQAAAPERQEQQ